MANRARKWFTLRRMMIAVAVVAVLLGGWAARVRYRSPGGPIHSLIKIQPQVSILGPEDTTDQEAKMVREIKTQCQLIGSPTVLSGAVASLQVTHPQLLAGRTDPVSWLSDGIRIEPIPGTWLITVSIPGEPRANQAVIINTVTEKYLRAAENWEAMTQHKRLTTAEELHAQYRQGLIAKRQELREAEANATSPEIRADLRDTLTIREEMTRRLGLIVEERRLELNLQPQAVLIDAARSQ